MPPAHPAALHDAHLDYRVHPDAYAVGRGEQGVLTVEPYKSEILPHWRFKTPAIAEASAKAIVALYDEYKQHKDFVGMDMSRKFLQMGVTRSRRYANHANGRKKDAEGKLRPQEHNVEKAHCAEIFGEALRAVKNDPEYKRLRDLHQAQWARNAGG